MYLYHQSTGSLFKDGIKIGSGYSGFGAYKNKPEAQSLADLGPIPSGVYTIGAPFTDPEKGPLVMRLVPDPSNEMFGRAGFLIHGDSIKNPGTASHGCIILDHNLRQAIAFGPDRILEVTV